MSDVCKEIRGWFKSFTKTEIYLSFLQAVFLISLISIVTFLVLHFLVCPEDDNDFYIDVTVTVTVTQPPLTDSDTITTSQSITSELSTLSPSERSTLSEDVECTWTPSRKTEASAHYYESGEVITIPSRTFTRAEISSNNYKPSSDSFKFDGETMGSDDNVAENYKKAWLLALVKIEHPKDVLFGCTLTVVSIHWTLTAASCIEAIEEVDALDYFVMVERFGEETRSVTHELSEVIVHPLYQGVNRSYDLAAIKSEDRLLEDADRRVQLPTALDASLVTLGERLSVLGFGKLGLEDEPRDRRVREVAVWKLSPRQCPGAWSARHLGRAGGAGRGRGGRGAACAGGGARACPCAGAPLLAGDLLLGVLSDAGACGPALYVDVALQTDWLRSVLLEH